MIPSRLVLIIAVSSTLAVACARPPAMETTARARKTLKVLDINVWAGLDYKGNFWMGEYDSADGRARRRRILIDGILKLDPDVIGVHEANKLPGYAEDLARDLGMLQMNHPGVGGVRAGPVGLPWNLREGDAILVKPDLGFQPVAREQLSGGYVGSFFTLHFEDATQILAARIVVNGKPVTLYTTHWHASPFQTPAMSEFLEQAAARRKSTPAEIAEAREEIRKGALWRLEESTRTADFVSRTAQGTVLLFGDFNATMETPELGALVRAGFIDSFRAAGSLKEKATWDPVTNTNQIRFYPRDEHPETLTAEIEDWFDHQPKRIDHILYKAGSDLVLVPRVSSVVLDEAVDGAHASDHFGIFTEFEILP